MCRVKEDKALITLEFSGRHDKDSHKGLGSGRITESQKRALETVVRTNPQLKAKSVRRARRLTKTAHLPHEHLSSATQAHNAGQY